MFGLVAFDALADLGLSGAHHRSRSPCNKVPGIRSRKVLGALPIGDLYILEYLNNFISITECNGKIIEVLKYIEVLQ